MALPMWFRLTCPCGSEKFTAVVHLRAHPSGGSATEQGGYLCVECGKIADMAKLRRDHGLKMKKAELHALEAEVKAT
jgi:hypothetical protein